MTSKKGLRTAAGMVLLRERKDEVEVAVVHRPAYDDWTLPKGRPDTDEVLPVTAVREVREETGYEAMLGMPIGNTEHPVNGQIKRTYWWHGTVVDDTPHPLDPEVDRVEWLSLEEARRRLTYASDAHIMAEAAKLPPALPFLIVRHAKAMSRKHWTGADADRRLDERGRRQAKRVCDLLKAYGVTLLASSSSTRCLSTFTPFATKMGLQIDVLPELSEEEASAHPEQIHCVMESLLSKALKSRQRLAVCGHRPVLPMMLETFGVTYRPMKPSEALVAYLDRQGHPVQVERIPPRF